MQGFTEYLICKRKQSQAEAYFPKAKHPVGGRGLKKILSPGVKSCGTGPCSMKGSSEKLTHEGFEEVTKECLLSMEELTYSGTPLPLI